MSNFRLPFSKCPAVLCKWLVNILKAKFIRNFRRKNPRGNFTIAKGYYWSKELFIETFRLAVYPGYFPKNWQNPWSDWKNFSDTRRMRRIFSAHVQIFRGDLDLYEGYLFPTELPTLLKVSFANAVLEYAWSYIHSCTAGIELYTQPM